MSEKVLVSIKEEMATIVLNRPEKLNALDIDVWHGLAKAAGQIKSNAQVKVALLTGAGDKAFSSGLDLSGVGEIDTDYISNLYFLIRHLQNCFNQIENLSIPVIAVINGYCIGGGVELALVCDIRLASEKAIFSIPEVKMGMCPDMGGTQRLPRLIGIGKAKELIFTGKEINAEEALRIGLIEGLYPPDQLYDAATKIAQEIASNPQPAVQAAKKAINISRSTSLEDGLNYEASVASNIWE